MTSNQLLKLSLRALETMQPYNVRGIPDMPTPFDRAFSVNALREAIAAHIEKNDGFSVVLSYPHSAEGDTFFSDSAARTWQEAALDVAKEMLEFGDVTIGDTLAIRDVFGGRLDYSPLEGADLTATVRCGLFGLFLLDSRDGARYDNVPNNYQTTLLDVDMKLRATGWRVGEDLDRMGVLRLVKKVLEEADGEDPITHPEAFMRWVQVGAPADRYTEAVDDAVALMSMFSTLEPTSALKQAGSEAGIPYGDRMGEFVEWARPELARREKEVAS